MIYDVFFVAGIFYHRQRESEGDLVSLRLSFQFEVTWSSYVKH